MDKFDLTKFLAEGKLNEAMFDVEATTKIAQQIADAFTAGDDLDLKYVVSPDVKEGAFNLDVEAGENTPGEDWKDENGFDISNYLGKYAGGSFTIKPEGDGYVIKNAAMKNAVVGYVTPEGELDFVKDQEQHYDNVMSAKESKEDIKEEQLKSNKMKKSELKEMIKAAMMAETSVDEAEKVDVTDDENIDVDVEKDVEVDDTETTSDIDVKTTVPGENADVEAVQGLLMKAQEEAAKLGDEKLTDQIGNTITYFTRSHVSRVAEADVDGPDTVTTNIDDVAAAEIGLDESVAFPMWNKIK